MDICTWSLVGAFVVYASPRNPTTSTAKRCDAQIWTSLGTPSHITSHEKLSWPLFATSSSVRYGRCCLIILLRDKPESLFTGQPAPWKNTRRNWRPRRWRFTLPKHLIEEQSEEFDDLSGSKTTLMVSRLIPCASWASFVPRSSMLVRGFRTGVSIVLLAKANVPVDHFICVESTQRTVSRLILNNAERCLMESTSPRLFDGGRGRYETCLVLIATI